MKQLILVITVGLSQLCFAWWFSSEPKLDEKQAREAILNGYINTYAAPYFSDHRGNIIPESIKVWPSEVDGILNASYIHTHWDYKTERHVKCYCSGQMRLVLHKTSKKTSRVIYFINFTAEKDSDGAMSKFPTTSSPFSISNTQEPSDGTERMFVSCDTNNLTTYNFKSPMTCKNGPNCGAYLRFYNKDMKCYVADLYIKSGTESVPLTLPLGVYTMDYALGEKWYGYNSCFGNDGMYFTFRGEMHANRNNLNQKWKETRSLGKWLRADKSKFLQVQQTLPRPTAVWKK